jgi:DNA-binding GntR family transcriptional regulator
MVDLESWMLDGRRPAKVIHADLTEQTYRLLRDRILRREIKAGARVSVDAIADRVGVSRTPVTDALKRLAADGLVKIVPRRGTFVAGITSRDAAEMFEVRLMIERFAAATALSSGRAAAAIASMGVPLAGMEAANDEGSYEDYEAFIDHDRRFHLAIVAAIENQRLLRLYEAINSHMYVARAHYIQTVAAAREAQSEHEAIHEALAGGDADRVDAALTTHIEGVRNRVVAIIDREGGLI